MTEMRFFIYGSMTEGLVHFNKIQEFIQDTVPGAIPATAYRLKVGFPVLTEDKTTPIRGTLARIKESSAGEFLLNLMDEFHGFNRHDESKSLYFRRSVMVQTQLGGVLAWCYFLNPKKLPKNAVLLADGDWQQSLQSEPTLTAKLNDRQRSYVQRLGASVGREIVPIDLPLYRELMNLELIVDKGRRLALSKLGQEVYRYL